MVIEPSDAATRRIGDLQSLIVLPGDRQGSARISLKISCFASIVTRLTQIHVIDERDCGAAARIDLHDVYDYPLVRRGGSRKLCLCPCATTGYQHGGANQQSPVLDLLEHL